MTNLIIYSLKKVLSGITKVITLGYLMIGNYSLVAQCLPAGAPVLINEMMINPAQPPTTPQQLAVQSLIDTAYAVHPTLPGVADDVGPDLNSEWIELYNPSPCNPVDISCYVIGFNASPDSIGVVPKITSTSYRDYGSFTFPPGTIIPPLGFVTVGGHAVPGITFDLKTYAYNGQGLLCFHKRLFLANPSGYIALMDPSGTVVDAVYWAKNAAQLNTNPRLDNTYLSTCNCHPPANMTIPMGKAIPGIEFTVDSLTILTNSGKSIQRQLDGSFSWTIGPPTLNACNGGPATCYSLTLNATATPNPTCNTTTGTTSAAISNTGLARSPYNYSWAPAGGTTATASGLPEGTYTVTVTDGCGCTKTASSSITGHPVLKPDFNAAPVCVGGTTVFTDQSTITPGTSGVNAITGWSWDFGEPGSGINNTSTLQQPTHTYATAGTYTVTLTISAPVGCDSSIAIPVTVNPLPIPAFTSPAVCFGAPVVFTDQSQIAGATITNWAWNFGEPSSGAANTSTLQSPSHTYASTGNYTVTLTIVASTGCDSMIALPVTVKSKPSVSFTTPAVCEGAPSLFTGQSADAIINWAWDFGEPASGGANTSTLQNASHVYASPGNYTVTLTGTASGGCDTTVMMGVTVNAIPLPLFTAPGVCMNNQTVFTDQSSITSGTISSWAWDFGEPASGVNNTSTLQNPKHTYSAAGVYTVTLTVTSNQGCDSTTLLPVTIHPLPIVNFNAQPGCIGDATAFTDLSSVSVPGTITDWSWNFGDPGSGTNNTSTLQNPSHTYNSSGSYTVVLTITTDKNCQSTLTKSVIVAPPPTASFTGTTVCVGNATGFADTSPGAVNKWSWDFGDAKTDTIKNPQHLYASSGTYTVTLTITSSNGCTASSSSSVTVNPGAIPEFNSTNVCFGQSNSFTDASTVNGSAITSWEWNFGDGTASSTITNPTHSYTVAGTYSVTLTVATINNCSASISKIVEVYALPVAGFTPSTVCVGGATVFQNNSTGTIISWDWNFGESGATASIASPSHTYDTAGVYSTVLIVTTDKGCKDTSSHNVTVNALPMVNFTVDTPDGCVDYCAKFTDQSMVAGSTITAWLWNFGDAQQSTLQNPLHCYLDTGAYDVSLQVTSGAGCIFSDTSRAMIKVHGNPKADFSVSPQQVTVITPEVHIADHSTGATEWHWDFGDGNEFNGKIKDSLYVYSGEVPGTYTIWLHVKNNYGCIDSTYRTIVITPDFTFYVPNTFTPNGDGLNDVFYGTGVGILEKQMYIYDRWGNEIFYSASLTGVWDGKVQGGASRETVQQDTYVWLIRIKDVYGNWHSYIGHVNVIR